MRGFREIRTCEKITERDEEKGYKKIKPTVVMTDKELETFWLEEFEKAAREAAEQG